SGDAAMPLGLLPAGSGYSVTLPLTIEILAMRFPDHSVSQIRPSAPTASDFGPLPGLGRGMKLKKQSCGLKAARAFCPSSITAIRPSGDEAASPNTCAFPSSESVQPIP